MRVVATLAWLGAAAMATWRALPRDTDRRRVRAGALRALARGGRSLVVRFALWFVGWPHVIDVFFGARRLHRDGTPSDEVWRHGQARMVRYRRPHGDPPLHEEPVLLVHSMVSQPWILDLTPTRSLAGALVQAGYDVFLLDWGHPGAAQAMLGLAEHADLLREAEAAVLSVSGAPRLHRVGYCFGATLCLYAGGATYVASTVLIAPVVDFAAPGGFQLLLGRSNIPPVLALDSGGCVPAAVVREAFHGLRPQALRTMWMRARHGRRSAEYREFYAAMARWAWHHRRLPGALFFDVVDLYRTNWLLRSLAPAEAPTLVVVAERDHIVPPRASIALHADLMQVPAGHVSMLVGSAAARVVWPGIAEWLAGGMPENCHGARTTGVAAAADQTVTSGAP